MAFRPRMTVVVTADCHIFADAGRLPGGANSWRFDGIMMPAMLWDDERKILASVSVALEAESYQIITFAEVFGAQRSESKYPPAKPGALRSEPLKAAGRGRSCAPVAVDRSRPSPPIFSFLGGDCLARKANTLVCASLKSPLVPCSSHLVHALRQQGTTAGNVKRLLPPRQSRGNSQVISMLPSAWHGTG
jgi:hypothetical protein